MKPIRREHRRSERRPADWIADYMIEGRTEDGWHPCRITDLSLGGAALELVGSRPAQINRRLVIDLRTADGESQDIQLRGEIKNQTVTEDGTIRVGVEFVEPTELERSILESLLEHQASKT
jgi:c-di-GMP-binding flagellar brake protein YcgR